MEYYMKIWCNIKVILNLLQEEEAETMDTETPKKKKKKKDKGKTKYNAS